MAFFVGKCWMKNLAAPLPRFAFLESASVVSDFRFVSFSRLRPCRRLHAISAISKAARRKFAALQAVILNERRMPGVKDLNRRSPTPPPWASTSIPKHLNQPIPEVSQILTFAPGDYRKHPPYPGTAQLGFQTS